MIIGFAALQLAPRGPDWKQDKMQLRTVLFSVRSGFSTKSHQHSWQQINTVRHAAIEKDLKAFRSIVANPIHPFMITVYHCLMDTCSRIRLSRRTRPYEIDLLRMKIRLMYPNGLQSNQMSFQLSAFGIPLNRRFTSLMQGWGLSSSCMIISS